MRHFREFKTTTIGMKPQSEADGVGMAKAAGSMMHFREFKATTVGRKPQSETGGKEKRAYDYEHEAGELQAHHDVHSKETPLDPATEAAKGKRSGQWGGGILGGLHGALLGGGVGASLGGSGKALALGAGLGALAGGGLGAWAGGAAGHQGGLARAMESKLGIEESQRIMAMPPDERKKYLQHLARQNEISAREEEEWNRHSDAEWAAERRHQESLDEQHRRHQEHMDELRGYR